MTPVRWEELLPREFVQRQEQLPVVYLPMGLCEPHGHAAAFGLDTLKAVWLCEQAAERFGGVVAPTQGYHVHEVGYHKPWLEQVVGDINPRLGSVPPDVVLRSLLFQIRAFANAGFSGIVIVTGHHGNQPDLRLVAEEFTKVRPVTIIAVSDPELVTGKHRADHAGRYELSQLMFIRPDLVDLDRVSDTATSPLGNFAQGNDASLADSEYGQQILQASLDELGRMIETKQPFPAAADPISIEQTEQVWAAITSRRDEWWTLRDWHPEHAQT